MSHFSSVHLAHHRTTERAAGPRASADGEPDDELCRAEGVSKRFAGVQALAGVNLTVRTGEVVGLIGPNGSGKTTLLNIISGLLRPTEGRVRVGGTDIGRRPPHRVAALGVGRTFQQIRLFADMTVDENVAVGALARGLGRQPERVSTLLATLGLERVAGRPAGTLAYGQQRRVEIARALAGTPALLLLDEPAAGMNESESDDLLRSIQAIVADGTAVLIVDHDLRLMMRLCQRIHVLAEGRTIAEGTSAEVRADPAVIAAYLGSEAKSPKSPTNQKRENP